MNALKTFALLIFLTACSGIQAQITAVVTTPADSGAGSLRQAMQDTNASGGGTINFRIDPAVSGPGPWTIALRTELPELTRRTFIMGFSQPGSMAPSGTGQSKIMIEVDGSAIARDANNYAAVFAFVRGAEKSVLTGLSVIGRQGNQAAGVLVLANSVAIRGNYIGLRADGMTPVPNDVAIGVLACDGVVIGGPVSGAGNLIVGGTQGLLIDGASHLVANNWFGTDKFGARIAGSPFLGNAIFAGGAIGYGMPPRLQTLYSPTIQATFWGLRTTTFSDNRITNSLATALILTGSTANPPTFATLNNRVTNNAIGPDLWNTPSFSVQGGIRLDVGVSGTQVLDNTITTPNANFGILLGNGLVSTVRLAGNGNSIRRNIIRGNTGHPLNMDVVNFFQPLANDPLDADGGANNGQNKPDLSFANSIGYVEGKFSGLPNRTVTLDFYMANQCDVSGFGGSDFYLGEKNIVTDSIGNALFTFNASSTPFGGLRVGQVITATATLNDANGQTTDTSEFSACIPVMGVLPTQTDLVPVPKYAPAMDPSLFLSAKVSDANNSALSGTVRFTATTDVGQLFLGNATLSNNIAMLPATANGLLPRSGRYQIAAEYLGDPRHSGSISARQPLVVFRPPAALIKDNLSNLVRVALSGMTYEIYDAASANWQALPMQNGDRIIDSAPFQNSRLDKLISVDPSGNFALTQAFGNRNAVMSNGFKNSDRISDFAMFDANNKMDALVFSNQTNKWQMTLCAFDIDNCESTKPLSVNSEYIGSLSGDFNGDGNMDILWLNSKNKPQEIWLMDGATPIKVIPIQGAPADAAAVTTGDFDGDGYEDIAFYAASTLEFTVWFMDSGKPAHSATARLRSMDLQTRGPAYFASATSADYGHAYLILRDGSTGDVLQWSEIADSNGALTFVETTLYTDPTKDLLPTR
jgi:hypothetical protein